MGINNYNELVTAVQDYILRSDIPTASFIRLAEVEFNPLIKHYNSETVASLPVISGAVSLPTDFMEIRSVKINGYSVYQIGIQEHVESNSDIFYRQIGNKLVFGNVVDGTDVEVIYWARIPSLTPDNPTNWLLLKFPSVYLHGTLAKAYRWAKDDVAEGIEKQSLVEALSLVDADNKRGIQFAAAPNFGGSAW